MAVGEFRLATDPRFSGNAARVEHTAELDAVLVSWFRARKYTDISHILTESEIQFNKTYTIKDILLDPQFKARNTIIRFRDPDFGTMPAPCIVPRLTGTQIPIPRSGPKLGEHNQEKYAALGLSDDDLNKLGKDNAI